MRVRYYGHVGAQTGYGIAAEHMCRALLAAGVELEICPMRASTHATIHIADSDPLWRCLRSGPLDPNVDVTIVHTLPMDCARVLSIAHPPGRRIAYTTLDFANPAMPYRMLVDALCGLDTFSEWWFPCTKNVSQLRNAIEAADRPNMPIVRAMPHAYRPALMLGEGLDEIMAHAIEKERQRYAYTFYYIGEWSARKNPLGVLLAYMRAFKKTDPVRLLLRSDHGSDAIRDLEATGLRFDDSPRIEVLGRMTDLELEMMHQAADCFVTATRAEAWNLPAFDAMLAGRHIITPDDRGSDDFLRDTSAAFVSSHREPMQIGERQSPDFTWDTPDIPELAVKMQDAFSIRMRHLARSYKPEDRYSYKVVGALARSYMEQTS